MKKINHNNEPALDIEFEESASEMKSGPVTVLGKTFADDDERRAYFREQLRAKLPELRKIEGFPIGSDDDIINLSDPPYYTACPNPWLNDFIEEWEQEKKQLEAEGKRLPNTVVNEPYAADVSDIKNDSVYRAHTYHTKVPHTIIMRYILHYTQPGDIIFDGFAGTGMTGLACQSCENPTDGVVSKLSSATTYRNVVWGKRHGICGDLSPYASLIAYNYNTPINSKLLEKEVKRIQIELNNEIGWMYSTIHDDGSYGEIKCVIWSDMIYCPQCGAEHILWNLCVDKENRKLIDEVCCPICGRSFLTKEANKVHITEYDGFTGEAVQIVKNVPVRIVYVSNGNRYERDLTEHDKQILERIENYKVDCFIPTHKYMGKGIEWGDTWRAGVHFGITRVHQFYTRRNLIALAKFYEKVSQSAIANKVKFIFTGMINRSTKMNRVHFNKYLKGGSDWDAGHLKGTMYIPSFPVESSVLSQISNKLARFIKAAPMLPPSYDSIVNVASATNSSIKPNSVDYIFTDPPFGANIIYSELNFLPEGWLNVITNNNTEAIISPSSHKGLFEYQTLMIASFREYYRILKPGKWMTVEFSNTSASVWNTIHQALSQVGFVIANVSALNKGQGGMRSITTTTAVNQDLAISCFKPSEKMLEKFEHSTNASTNVWDFITELLEHLPIHTVKGNLTTAVVERSPKILYDRLISFYVQHGYDVPMDAREFQAGLRERFIERDGMFFTASQANEYDVKRRHTEGVQTDLFFVDSEQNGINWLRNELSERSQTYQDLQPKWMQAIQGLRKGDILPELMQILEENFIKEPDGKWRVANMQDDIDLEALRLKALLREFKTYVEVANKPKGKIKEARVEALRTGFKQAYRDKDFATIVKVGDRIPQNLLQEDEVLLQFYNIALGRL
jgi:DNA modification methylase